MQKLLLSTLLFLSSCLMAQVSGIATLMGETNHSGIKVLFTAASPSAKTDSTYTDALGNYSKTLAAGTYKITFSKRTFNTTPYPQNVFVNGVANLNPIELFNAVVKNVSGNLSGVWSKDTIYAITDVITIPENDSLIIEPGVTIYLSYTAEHRGSIMAYGTLKMQGTISDSIKVVPTKNQRFLSKISISTHKNTIFAFIYSKAEIFEVFNDNYLSVSNNTIANSKFKGLAVSLNGNNEIFNNLAKKYATFSYDRALFVSQSNIYCNVFNYDTIPAPFTNQDTSMNSLNVHNNIFNFYTTYTQPENFLLITSKGSNLSFKNNYIKNYPGPIKIENNGSFLEFKNNTIKDTSYTWFNISGKYSNLHIVNNIFNRVGLSTDIPNPSFDFTQNQYAAETSFGNMIGAGIPIAKNTQGLNIDTYGNIIEAPKFTKIPLLASDSPMLGAGISGSNIGFYPYGTCLEGYFKDWNKVDTVDVVTSHDSLSISGKVYATNVSLTNTLVKAVDTKTYKEYSTLTDQDGNFLLDSLPMGTYYIVTSPNPSMTGSYQTTYYPKKASLDQAEILSLESNIFDMKIYLVPSGPDAVDDLEFTSFAYPNPFKDELVIQKTNNEGIIVTDITGRQMYSASEDKDHIDTHAWPAGIYMVKIQQKVLKFVKE